MVAYSEGPLLLQGRDPDRRVMVLERSEENPQLTWMWTHALRIPPSSTLCRGLQALRTVLPHADKARHIHPMHRIGEEEWKVLN